MNKIKNTLFFFNLWTLILLTKISKPFFLLFKKNPQDGSVLYLENFPFENAGFQYRSYKWGKYFKNQNRKFQVLSSEFEKSNFDKFLAAKNKSLFSIKYMWRKFSHVLQSRKFETVIVRRELLIYNDFGNLFMEKFLLSIHDNAILDFDDDLSYAKSEPREVTNLSAKLMLDNGTKFLNSLSLYNKFLVGSAYLKKFTLKRRKSDVPAQILVLPTCLDYEKHEGKNYLLKGDDFVLGWIGGNHNQKLLSNLIEPLNKLATNFNFKLHVISGHEFKPANANFEILNDPWGLETEINSLYKIDIGLMPLEEKPGDKGKAGFKLLQYMGLGIVGVASGVTVNKDIIEDGKNGFLVNSNDWVEVLSRVFKHKDEFPKIGKEARKTVYQRYSFESNYRNLSNFVKNK